MAGVTPAGYNNSNGWLVQSSTATSVTWATTLNPGNVTVQGTIAASQFILQGNQIWEMPEELTDASWPFLVTESPVLIGYSKSGQMVSQQDPGYSMHSEPNWDIECYVLYPHDPKYPKYAEVEAAKVLYMQVWGKFRDLDSQKPLWTAAGITDTPSPWMIKPYGFQRRYVRYADPNRPINIALWFGIRVIELLGRLPAS